MLVLVLALGLGAGAVLFAQRVVLHPRLDPVAPADAIVLLGGYGDGTLRYAQQLLADGVAPELVVSDPYQPGENQVARTCAAPGPTTTCFVPDPSRTIGESREIARLGAERGWQRVVVVTGQVHVSRARYIVEQCWSGGLAVTAPDEQVRPGGVVFQTLYQAVGFARTVVDGC